MRQTTIERNTKETQIRVVLNLDGSGQRKIATPLPFFNHMLDSFGRHSLVDLQIDARGDVEVDGHHTVEDVGICLGQAFREALGDKRGIARFGHALVPMDEALAEAAVDLSGRAHLAWTVPFHAERIGSMDTELFEEFFRALAMNGLVTMHVTRRAGHNAHHVAEACFKAAARALRAAVEADPRAAGAIPSTKGSL